MNLRIFIQARMSSVRFPGKMLAPFRGRPLIAHVLGQFHDSDLRARLVVLTSCDRTDDPLADFVADRCGVPVFRGDLENVIARFQSAIVDYPCEWFVRISGDSPLIDAALVQTMIGFCDPAYDLVTNVARRTFPPGQSVECLRSDAFRAISAGELTPDQREHVTKVFYDRPHDWRIRSVISRVRTDARMTVDTPEELWALERGVGYAINFGDTAALELL